MDRIQLRTCWRLSLESGSGASQSFQCFNPGNQGPAIPIQLLKFAGELSIAIIVFVNAQFMIVTDAVGDVRDGLFQFGNLCTLMRH